MSESILFTLFSGNYAYGTGALVNSVYKCGFKGKIIIGYKDNLPFWAHQLKKLPKSYLLPTNDSGIELIFKKVDIDYHLRYFKPTMFKSIFADYPHAKVFYFDPDITVIGDWSFFEEWVSYGVACVLDENFPYMPYNHPIKYKWTEIFNYKINHTIPFNFYVNSGFIGCQIKNINLINDWENHILLLKEKGGNLKTFEPVFNHSYKYRRLNSLVGDQDVLNATLNKNHLDYNLSMVGPDGMGFIQPCYLMYHITGKKTWNKNILLDFFNNGIKISPADDSFLDNCRYPLVLFSNFKWYQLKLIFILTKILQRVF